MVNHASKRNAFYFSGSSGNRVASLDSLQLFSSFILSYVHERHKHLLQFFFFFSLGLRKFQLVHEIFALFYVFAKSIPHKKGAFLLIPLLLCDQFIECIIIVLKCFSLGVVASVAMFVCSIQERRETPDMR